MKKRVPPAVAAWRALHRRGRLRKIEGDPKVRRFVDSLLPTHTFAAIERKGRAKHGPGFPSKSAIHRYWHRTRPDR